MRLSVQGRRLSQVHRMFPTGLVLGVYNKVNEQTMLNPPTSRRIQQNDVLVMMRPTSVASEHYKPIEAPVPIDLGTFPLANEKSHSHTQDLRPISKLGGDLTFVHITH